MAAKPAFAVWITGLPASGKSTLTRALKAQLEARDVYPAVLESDVLRQIMGQAGYAPQDRDMFYRVMTYIGVLLTGHGVSVIFDATANRREYRDAARRQIPRFLEVFVDTPLETCLARDPKGIYRQAREGSAENVPGLQATYEPPERPDVLVHGDAERAEDAAGRVIAKLLEKGYL